MEVSGNLYASGKETHYPFLNRRLGGPRTGMDTLEER
jgi:hypothetical protein